jgi:hypothetical protein
MNAPLFFVVIAALFAFSGCSDSETGNSNDTGIQADAGTYDGAVPDAIPSDEGSPDSTADAEALEDTADALPDNDLENGGQDTNSQDTNLEDTDLEETLDDVLPPDDAMEDIEADVATPAFGQPVEISSGTGYESGELHAMSVNELGNVTVFWRGTADDGTVAVLASVSDATAGSFLPPVAIKEGMQKQGIAVGGDMLQAQSTYYFTWRDLDDAGNDVVLFRRTTTADFGGEDVALDTGAGAIDLWRPQLVRSNDGTLCAMWERKNGQAADVFLRCSLDDGLTWNDEVQVDDPDGMNATVSAARFNSLGALVVALQIGQVNGTHITVRVSDDLGLTWTQATTVDGSPIENGQVSASLAEGSNLIPSMIQTMTGNLKLAWHKPLPGATGVAYLTTSQDGLSWTAPTLIPETKVNVGLVRGRGSDLHVSSVESILGQGDTLYMSSPDEGETWGLANPVPKTMNSTLIDHRMRANLVEGWLYIAWWESLPGNLLKQKLLLMTVGGP